MNPRPAEIPIAVTGIGPVCPDSLGIAELREAGPLLGRTQTRERSMSHFDPQRYLGKRGFKYFSSATRYALAAAGLALEDAGLLEDTIYQPESKGVFMGSNFGVLEVARAMDSIVLSQGAGALLAVETPNFSVNIPASYISLKHRFLAFNVTLTNMLVAGLEVMMLGAQSIRNGRAQLVLAGATEGAITAHSAAPLGTSASDGAACMLALEALPAAQARGARIYARTGIDLLCFIPPEEAETPQTWRRQDQFLRQQLDRLPDDLSGVHLVMLELDCPFVRRVNESVLCWLQDQSVTIELDPPSSRMAPEACVSPLLWLGASIARHGDALVLVANPQGHIALMSTRS